MLGENQSFFISAILYSFATMAYFIFFVFRKQKLSNYGSILIKIGLVFHTISLISRTVTASRLPISNQYEFATSFAWGISIFYLIFEKKYRYQILGTFASPIILILIYYAAMQSKDIRPLMPALQSNWIVVHVVTAIFSYGAFAIACAISLIYLIRDHLHHDSFITNHIPSPELLDIMSYRAIAIGFLSLTLVIVTGAVWAEKAWGRYWQWDPKETWSFITWVIYSIYLHVRLTKGWKGKKAAWFSVAGFASILFTYIGVNTILVGYHSYSILFFPFLK